MPISEEPADEKLAAINSLSVEGFKSIGHERSIKIRPLTILAGANSSGKSSIMQPLLLLKQTLESAYDPGPLLLNGPNVEFTAVSQLLSNHQDTDGNFAFGISLNEHVRTVLHFRKSTNQPLELDHMSVTRGINTIEHRAGVIAFSESHLRNSPIVNALPSFVGTAKPFMLTVRERCFLNSMVVPSPEVNTPKVNVALMSTDTAPCITSTIHVPGLRGNPRRNYPITAVGNHYAGTFDKYVASVISVAQRDTDARFLDQLGTDLRELGLTWRVQAQNLDDTQVELRVGRLPKMGRSGATDLVSIADVGFGVSQTLPVVVALLTARPGQLVYIEQPEIHLHPRAQNAMAGLLARAAIRGVRVVIETHSSLLLLGIQSIIARGDLDPSLVKLHWFQRDEQTGMTNIESADLDDAGRFGEWPEDFDDVSLGAQQQYLDAAEKKLFHGA